VKAEPLVTIALAMRDSAATIAPAIRSLVAQTYPHWELRLYDDGSTDASVERARAFADARIHLVADGARRGLPARLNQAIDAAQGELYARMDADDVAYPERLERQVAFLQAHAEVDLVASAMMVFGDDGRAIGLHPIHLTHAEICAHPYRGFYFPHPTWLGRTAWFRRWRYDASYSKAQDQDLLRRAWRESRFAGIAEPLVGYRQDRVSIGKSWRGRYHSARSALAAGRRDRARLPSLAAVGSQVARAGVEAAVIGLGLERRVLGHRARGFTAAQAARWAEVWRGVSG
jgi:glycosyltransferase involved in cell wall biosynthesis